MFETITHCSWEHETSWRKIKQGQGNQCRSLDLDLDIKDIFCFGYILVLVTFQFCWYFSFDDISVLVKFLFLTILDHYEKFSIYFWEKSFFVNKFVDHFGCFGRFLMLLDNFGLFWMQLGAFESFRKLCTFLYNFRPFLNILDNIEWRRRNKNG